jgi:hypothetical protein
MESDSHGLRHRCRVVVASIRNPMTDGGRGRHVLGETSVHFETKCPVVGAEVRPTLETPGTPTARDTGSGDQTIADCETRNVSPDVDHSPDELVSEYDARAAEDGSMIPLRRVRATDRCADHLEHDLVRLRPGQVGNILDSDIARPAEYGCPHAISTRFGP